MIGLLPIEKGVPLPAPKERRNGLRYPWADMEPCDSFFIPGATANSHTGLVSKQNRTGKARFTLRAVDGGVRVWRVE